MRLSTAVSCLFLLAPQQGLETLYSVRGVVDMTGKPVAGATVEALGLTGQSLNRGRHTVSLEDGSVHLGDLNQGTYRLYVWKHSEGVPNSRFVFFQTKNERFVEVAVGPSAASPILILKLPAAFGSLSGSIRTATDGSPVPKARIKLERFGESQIVFETSPSDDGNFLLYVPDNPFTMKVTAPG